MGKVYCVVALGPNDIAVPCIICKTYKEAEKYVERLPTDKNGFVPDNFKWEGFFTDYYGGCGEAYKVRIQEVEFNTPFIAWDLD